MPPAHTKPKRSIRWYHYLISSIVAVLLGLLSFGKVIADQRQSIGEVRARVTEIQNNYVPRFELDTHWDAISKRFDSIDSQLHEIRADQRAILRAKGQ